MQQAIKAHHAVRDRVPVHHRNGEIVWLWEKGRGVYDDAGQYLYTEGYVLDITRRKQMEEALRASEERYRTLVEQAADGIFLADPQGRYVDVNPAAAPCWAIHVTEILQLQHEATWCRQKI